VDPGLALTVFLTWSAVRDVRRKIRAERLAATPVPGPSVDFRGTAPARDDSLVP